MANEGSAEVRNWLSEHAWPLAGVVAGAPVDDLRPLGKALDGVRVVGLGEATHGTREFFQLKHRLFEYLVTELGFSVLAMEASESAAPAVDAYVRHSIGDAASVVSGLGFWTWRTEEVVALVEWMRSYNKGRPAAEQVGFAGIDPQRCSTSVDVVRAAHADADWLEEFDAKLGVLRDASPGSAPDPERKVVRDAEKLLGFLQGEQASAEVLLHAEILVRAAELVARPRQHDNPAETVFAARDAFLAGAVGRLVGDDPSKRVAVWAHNGHLAASRETAELHPMGWHLRKRFGSEYYALALVFGSGFFRARRMWPGRWPGKLDGPVVSNEIERGGFNSLEGQLAAANAGDHLLDLRSAADAPTAVKRWLEEPHVFRSYGAFVSRWTYKMQFAPTHLTQEYDGLAYVATSTPSRPLE